MTEIEFREGDKVGYTDRHVKYGDFIIDEFSRRFHKQRYRKEDWYIVVGKGKSHGGEDCVTMVSLSGKERCEYVMVLEKRDKEQTK